MRLKEIKDDSHFSWTNHSKAKMAYYHFSPDRVKRVLNNPLRREEGIAFGTMAAMQRAGSKKNPYEIWVMYVRSGKGKTRIISAWKYPGITKPGHPIPIPDDILKEIGQLI